MAAEVARLVDVTADELFAQESPLIDQRIAATRFMELSNSRVSLIARQPTADGRWVATYEDVTERRRAEERIVFMARHDALTGLPNRVFFAERIETAISQIGRGSSGFAVLSLDLDHFRQINDTLGHPVGDELLRSAAERVHACVREVDTVSRLGGDEFAILQAGLEKREDAALLARRIVEILSVPYEIKGMGLKLWFGQHTVLEVMDYNGPFDFVVGIARLSNGSSISLTSQQEFELAD